MTQLLGYGLSFLGLCYYNYAKFQANKAAAQASGAQQNQQEQPAGKQIQNPGGRDDEVPLLRHTGE